MKFKDIKEGDEVLIPVSVRTHECWGKGKTFYIKSTVERVTKTQFITGGSNYKKDCGKKIGGGYFECAVKEGDTFGYSKDIAKDETEEMEEFICEVKVINRAIKAAEELVCMARAKKHKDALAASYEILKISEALDA